MYYTPHEPPTSHQVLPPCVPSRIAGVLGAAPRLLCVPAVGGVAVSGPDGIEERQAWAEEQCRQDWDALELAEALADEDHEYLRSE